MSPNLGPMEVICDAPPYPIVQACNAIGVEAPEDVRWIKMSHYLAATEAEEKKKLASKPLLSKTQERLCPCKEKVPKLAKYRFTYSSGDEVTYSVGQCPKCRMVYWED
jgi:hypothetical protein